ncbi:uncharacterized protein LOC111247596 [Varroa destructor]|uniref:Uncharacterized protein n=2 Tax=Varroa TaxID=62624 RepID=A0A7M7JMY4_VARDE|nr:uncharacterized protein LOC111247596 [Varroa destructor]
MERVSDSAAKFEGANIDCPAIPIPVSDVIIQVDKCLQPLGRNLRDRAVKAMAGELEDCAQASLLMFMMNACQDADYLDKTVDCVLARQDAIITNLKLSELETEHTKKLFVCARNIHNEVKNKRRIQSSHETSKSICAGTCKI